MIDLTDFEKKMLDAFLKSKERNDEEIKKFIKIVYELREKPEKNPQLKGGK